MYILQRLLDRAAWASLSSPLPHHSLAVYQAVYSLSGTSRHSALHEILLDVCALATISSSSGIQDRTVRDLLIVLRSHPIQSISYLHISMLLSPILMWKREHWNQFQWWNLKHQTLCSRPSWVRSSNSQEKLEVSRPSTLSAALQHSRAALNFVFKRHVTDCRRRETLYCIADIAESQKTVKCFEQLVDLAIEIKSFRVQRIWIVSDLAAQTDVAPLPVFLCLVDATCDDGSKVLLVAPLENTSAPHIREMLEMFHSQFGISVTFAGIGVAVQQQSKVHTPLPLLEGSRLRFSTVGVAPSVSDVSSSCLALHLAVVDSRSVSPSVLSLRPVSAVARAVEALADILCDQKACEVVPNESILLSWHAAVTRAACGVRSLHELALCHPTGLPHERLVPLHTMHQWSQHGVRASVVEAQNANYARVRFPLSGSEISSTMLRVICSIASARDLDQCARHAASIVELECMSSGELRQRRLERARVAGTAMKKTYDRQFSDRCKSDFVQLARLLSSVRVASATPEVTSSYTVVSDDAGCLAAIARMLQIANQHADRNDSVLLAALDCEFDAELFAEGKCVLLQLNLSLVTCGDSTGNGRATHHHFITYVFDCLRIERSLMQKALDGILGSNCGAPVVVLLHAGSNDVKHLKQQFGQALGRRVALVDTAIVERALTEKRGITQCGFEDMFTNVSLANAYLHALRKSHAQVSSKNCGLGTLMEKYLGFAGQKNSSVRLQRWHSDRPPSQQFLDYAARDVNVLPQIFLHQLCCCSGEEMLCDIISRGDALWSDCGRGPLLAPAVAHSGSRHLSLSAHALARAAGLTVTEEGLLVKFLLWRRQESLKCDVAEHLLCPIANVLSVKSATALVCAVTETLSEEETLWGSAEAAKMLSRLQDSLCQ